MASAAFLLLALPLQAATFTGWSGGVGVGGSVNYSKLDAPYSYTNLPAPTETGSRKSEGDGGAVVSDLFAEYGVPLAGRWRLGLRGAAIFEGVRYSRSGNYEFPNPNGVGDYPLYSVETKLIPYAHASAALRPGYRLTDKVLVYSSLAYHFMLGQVKTKSHVINLTDGPVVSEASEKKCFSGIGVGGGWRREIRPDWFWDVSFEWVRLQKKTVTGPSLTGIADGITVTQTQTLTPVWLDLRTGLSVKF